MAMILVLADGIAARFKVMGDVVGLLGANEVVEEDTEIGGGCVLQKKREDRMVVGEGRRVVLICKRGGIGRIVVENTQERFLIAG